MECKFSSCQHRDPGIISLDEHEILMDNKFKYLGSLI